MAKDKEKDFEVVEETKSKKTTPKKKDNTPKESTLYYFYSVGCGFCKKAEPIVDELIKEGHDILKLDLAEKDNQGLKNELSQKYKKQCGTPWFIDGETGNQLCGFRDEETVKKWADGEKIPAPPKPKSPPPKPPQDFENKDEVDTWSKAYEDWSKENEHLPNVPKVEDMLSRLKQQQEMIKQRQQQQNTPGAPGIGAPAGTIEGRISSLEQKMDKLLNHLGVK